MKEQFWQALRSLEAKIEVSNRILEKLTGQTLGSEEIIAKINNEIEDCKRKDLVSIAYFAQLKNSLIQETDRKAHLGVAIMAKTAEVFALRKTERMTNAAYDRLSKDLTSPGACVLPFKKEKS